MSIANDPSAVLNAALALPREQRTELLREIAISLEPDEPKDPNYDRLLREELDRRWSAYERGEVKAIDWREALDQIEVELDARRRG